MSLLQEIQNEAVDSNSDLAAVLRKCKVLAAHLNSKPLENWLIWESNGYLNDAPLPAYREWALLLKGNLSDLFGRCLKSVPISSLNLPEDLIDTYCRHRCRDSIEVVQNVVARSTQSTLHFTRDSLPELVGDGGYENMFCISAWGEFSVSKYENVLSQVRNNVLDFALALSKEDPKAGDIKQPTSLKPAEVTQIFNTTVYGNPEISGHREKIQMGDNYQAGQAGAMGPQAHAHDITFQQVWNQHASSIDLPTLASELGTLLEALQKQATDPEHQVEIGNVAAAQQAAENNNGPTAFKFLKQAGSWTLGVARDLTIGVAASAIFAAQKGT